MKALRTAVLAAAALVVGAAWAQQSVDIVVAGRIVARVRDKGAYASLADRAAKIDRNLCDVISYEDTQHPKVSLQQVSGVWRIFVGKRDVMGVSPADAKSQNVDPKTLAGMWANSLKAALPFATPCSKLPPTTGGVKPAKPPVAGGTTGTTPGAGTSSVRTGVTAATPGHAELIAVTQTPGASTAPTGDTVPTPAPTSQPPQPKTMPRSAGLLLLLDAFNSVRVLSEEEYLVARDRLAANLIENLEPYMQQARSAGTASGTPPSPRPIEIVTPPAPKPPTVPITPAIRPTPRPPMAPSTPPKPPTTPKPTGPTVPSVPSVAGTATTRTPAPSGPSSPKVPQKQRIGRKFAAAASPYEQLKQSGGASVDQVTQLLKAARTAYAAGDFDTSEAAADQALQLMGVPIPK